MTATSKANIVVAALYRFVRIDAPDELRSTLLERMLELDIRGTLLVAPEGINGTIAGSRAAIDAFMSGLTREPRFAGLTYKESFCEQPPFARTKVKLKQEIVTMGVPDIDPLQSAGTYVDPQHWNELIRDPDVVVIDTRNDYEVGVGTFNRAIDPGIATFREFPDYVEKHLDPEQTPKVAMFCTGGIRCEKSTAYLKQCGFAEVYHLRGGILKYLEEVPATDSEWQGECFVFDERVTVDHELHRGQYEQCHACRRPVSIDEQQDPRYLPGVSCPHCHDETSPEQRQRFAEREKQMRLATDRHEPHLGDGTAISIVREQRRQTKLAVKNRRRNSARRTAGT